MRVCCRLIVVLVVVGVGFLPIRLAAEAGVADPDSVPIRADSLFSTQYLRQLWHDTGAVLTGPWRWDDSDWNLAGAWTGGTLLAAGFDHPIRRRTQAHFRTAREDRFFRRWQRLGLEYSFAEIGAFEVWGVAADNPNARATAMDAVSATIIASGLIAPTLKYAVGRYRPTQTTQTFKFRPFSGHQSFPSGHATQAFAVATVIAGHYPAVWQQSLAYGAAVLVDVARIQQNAHFASDVVAGSAIGWAVGRAIVHRHELPGGYTLAPWYGNGTGLMLTKNF